MAVEADDEMQKSALLHLKECEQVLRFLPREEFQLQTSNLLTSTPKRARKITPIFAVLAVSFGAYIHGTVVVFPAVAVPSMKLSNCSNDADDIPPLPFHITNDDISLIVSISAFGMLLGSLVAGPVANLIGRKLTCIVGTCGCLSVSYALIAGAQWIWMLLLGRFLHGTGLGFSTTVSTIYIMEIATPDMRGRLAVVPAIAGTLGVLTCQSLGAVLNWQWLSIVFASLNVPYFLFLLFIPETPVYLIGKNKIEPAHRVLRLLRGKQWDVTAELTNIKVASESAEEKQKVRLKELFASNVIKPFLIALTLMFFLQFSGINIIMQFTVEIFQTAESSVNEFQATIFFGIACFMSNLITLALADKMPRRLMLILSTLGVTLSLLGMGIQFYLKTLEREACMEKPEEGEQEDCTQIYTENLGWLPLFLFMVYIFFFSLGFGAMIWITVAEILPLHVRSVATSLAVGFTCIMSFLTSQTFLIMSETMLLEGVFWFYSGVSCLGLIFVVLCVPETKGKSEAEIQAYFNPKRGKKPQPERQ